MFYEQRSELLHSDREKNGGDERIRTALYNRLPGITTSVFSVWIFVMRLCRDRLAHP